MCRPHVWLPVQREAWTIVGGTAPICRWSTGARDGIPKRPRPAGFSPRQPLRSMLRCRAGRARVAGRWGCPRSLTATGAPACMLERSLRDRCFASLVCPACAPLVARCRAPGHAPACLVSPPGDRVRELCGGPSSLCFATLRRPVDEGCSVQLQRGVLNTRPDRARPEGRPGGPGGHSGRPRPWFVV